MGVPVNPDGGCDAFLPKVIWAHEMGRDTPRGWDSPVSGEDVAGAARPYQVNE